MWRLMRYHLGSHHHPLVHVRVVLHLVIRVFVHGVHLLPLLPKHHTEEEHSPKENKHHPHEGPQDLPLVKLYTGLKIENTYRVVERGTLLLPLVPRFLVSVFIFSF